jgi:hypothetical protein
LHLQVPVTAGTKPPYKSYSIKAQLACQSSPGQKIDVGRIDFAGFSHQNGTNEAIHPRTVSNGIRIGQEVSGRNQNSMKTRTQSLLAAVFSLVIAVPFLAGCSLLQPETGVVSERASLQNQRAASAMLALQDLQEPDALIRLDNRWLTRQFETVLEQQVSTVEQFSLRKLKVIFERQLIAVEANLDVTDKQGNVISAAVTGEVRLTFSPGHLEWSPHFSHIVISSRDFSFEDGIYAEPVDELNQYVLRNLNTEVAYAVIENGENLIPVKPFPLGEIQVGAALPGFNHNPARHTRSLRGIFMVAGYAMLIEPAATTIAVDMTFLADLSTCPADVTVSRALFTDEVVSREPVGVVTRINEVDGDAYFYSEISGAKRPLTVIHYWFADGVPVAVEELPVGPSERWRTWSSKEEVTGEASLWEVLVVEKESGCILHSQSIRASEAAVEIAEVDDIQAIQTFAAFRDSFRKRSGGFSVITDKPEIALVEIRRPFLIEVMQSALADLSIDADFDRTSFITRQHLARLQPFDSKAIVCAQRSCPEATVCNANLAQCKRFRDTRDCSSCLFRNPLNNRCVKEAVDPLCEASRNRQNARYEVERAACIEAAEAAKRECDRLNEQAQRSCQIESELEDSACESISASMGSMKPGSPLALVSSQTHAVGGLSASFSNFRIEGDLEGLKLDMFLKSDLQLNGELHFSPGNIARPLADCIVAWSTPFKTKLATTPAVKNLLSSFELNGSTLTANWSGFGLTVDTKPSPLESAFVDNPQLLAGCGIGLTVDKVESAFGGEDEDFFRGRMELEIQPLPSKLHFAPATIELGGNVYSAEATLSATHLRYRIGD